MAYTTTSQSLALSTTSIQSSSISSTKVRVTTNSNAAFYAVGINPTAYSTGNCEMLPANSVRYVNMQGLGNKIAFVLPPTGTSGNISITTIGAVEAAGQSASTTTYNGY